jgi:hypothetical protein
MKTKEELREAIKEAKHEARITFEEAKANHQRRLDEIETMESELSMMEDKDDNDSASA